MQLVAPLAIVLAGGGGWKSATLTVEGTRHSATLKVPKERYFGYTCGTDIVFAVMEHITNNTFGNGRVVFFLFSH